MSRRKLREEELMKATEALLLEKGYEGFHFQGLSKRLNVGRSTIYEYYSSKEELVTSYMLKVMQQIFDECRRLPSTHTPLQQLKELLHVFMKYSQIHQITQMIPMVNRNVSPGVKLAIRRLSEDHHRLFSRMTRLIDEAKSQGEIREDISSVIISRIFFTAIQIPCSEEIDPRAWSEMIFQVLYEGLGQSKSY